MDLTNKVKKLENELLDLNRKLKRFEEKVSKLLRHQTDTDNGLTSLVMAIKKLQKK